MSVLADPVFVHFVENIHTSTDASRRSTAYALRWLCQKTFSCFGDSRFLKHTHIALTDTQKIEAGESKARFKFFLVIWFMDSMNSKSF